MLARTHAFAIDGLDVRHVTVEVDVRPGLPAFAIVGLADAAVREARERVAAAIRNSALQFPARRITVNLAPADVRKAGLALDLALACAVLAASGQARARNLEGVALLGELSLDGRVRPCRGTLEVAEAAHRYGIRTLALCPEMAREASLVAGLEVVAVQTLADAVALLSRRERTPHPPPAAPTPASSGPSPDLCEVLGQQAAVRALEIAAAGGHSLLLSGPPGVGKTMLARRTPSILPPLSPREAAEVLRVERLLGLPSEDAAPARPFRAPHHSIGAAGLVGGPVGEVVLAHNGVLLLDELSEFSRGALAAIRQPLEEGRVALRRNGRSALYPCRFMLVATTNPCPCGHVEPAGRCDCPPAELARHRRRLNGALLDRLDLLVRMPPDASRERAPSSRQARERVRLARERQEARAGPEAHVVLNARIEEGELRRHARLDERAQRILDRARERGVLSARGAQRALRVARTIADLYGRERVRTQDLVEALTYRGLGDVGADRGT